MNLYSFGSYLATFFFFANSISTFAQTESNDSTPTDLTKVAREIIVDAGNCALITLDENGAPSVRAMDPFLPENDFTIWLGTNSKSRKVDQIKSDPRVTLYYFDVNASAYVTIRGNAEIVNSTKEKKNRWKKAWEAFYPDFPEGFSLIKVSPVWLEVISEKHGVLGDSISWQVPKHLFNSSN